MKHKISGSVRTIIAMALGIVTGEMMTLFLPIEALIAIAAVMIPALAVMAVLNIIGASRYNRFIKMMIEKLESGQSKTG